MWQRVNQTNNNEMNQTHKNKKKKFKQHTIANTDTSNLFIQKKKQLVTLVAGSRLHVN